MSVYACIAALVVATVLSFFFSTLTYALRDFSRAKLAEHLGRHDGDQWFETLTERTDQYIFITAVCRMAANLLTWLAIFLLLPPGAAFLVCFVLTLFTSIIVPLALARSAAEPVIGYSAPVLSVIRLTLTPLTLFMKTVDDRIRRALGVRREVQAQEIEQEIMSAVEEGEKEGVVDEQERELIENVIEFRDATAAHIMTARPEIVALDVNSDLEEARSLIESSGHSRLPVYDGSLEKIVGILYARDLIKFLGHPDRSFNLRATIRLAMFVPETKPVRNLLNDFRHQNVHIAIVLDEYGGAAGLVTIEDILEELVGEISDEHEPVEPAMFRKIGEFSAEADARLAVSELNRQLGLSLPEDAGYETLGGYLTTSMGRIPERGAVYESDSARFTVLDAEPRKINRVRIELMQTAKDRRAE